MKKLIFIILLPCMAPAQTRYMVKAVADTIESKTQSQVVHVNDTLSATALRINPVGSIIDSAVVVADTLKFYIGGVAYKAVKSGASLAWLWFVFLGVGAYEVRRRFA